jgi:hypothetical protein
MWMQRIPIIRDGDRERQGRKSREADRQEMGDSPGRGPLPTYTREPRDFSHAIAEFSSGIRTRRKSREKRPTPVPTPRMCGAFGRPRVTSTI